PSIDNRAWRSATVFSDASKFPVISRFWRPRFPASGLPSHSASNLASADFTVAWPLRSNALAVASLPESAKLIAGEEKLRSTGEPSSATRRDDLRNSVKLTGSLFH